MKRLPLLVAPVDRDEMSPVDGRDGVVVGLTGIDNLLDGALIKQCVWDDFVVSNNTVTEARHGLIVGGTPTCETEVVCDPLDANDAEASGSGKHFDTNAATDNAVGEWVLGPGLTDDTNETSQSNGKTFSIPPGGGILSTIR